MGRVVFGDKIPFPGSGTKISAPLFTPLEMPGVRLKRDSLRPWGTVVGWPGLGPPPFPPHWLAHGGVPLHSLAITGVWVNEMRHTKICKVTWGRPGIYGPPFCFLQSGGDGRQTEQWEGLENRI